MLGSCVSFGSLPHPCLTVFDSPSPPVERGPGGEVEQENGTGQTPDFFVTRLWLTGKSIKRTESPMRRFQFNPTISQAGVRWPGGACLVVFLLCQAVQRGPVHALAHRFLGDDVALAEFLIGHAVGFAMAADHQPATGWHLHRSRAFQ
jgi:hypothetical protein